MTLSITVLVVVVIVLIIVALGMAIRAAVLSRSVDLTALWLYVAFVLALLLHMGLR